MTATRTPSQLGSANRRRGITAERDLARYLRTHGWPHAERAVRTGFRAVDRTSADPGDITGTPGIVWSVKDCAVEQIRHWMDELDAMAAADSAVRRLLVHKRRGHADPDRWWCWMRVCDVLALVDDAETCVDDAETCVDDAETCFVFPVRMELGDALMLLQSAGYGTAVEGVPST